MMEINILSFFIKNRNPKTIKMEVNEVVLYACLFLKLNFSLAESYRPGLNPYTNRLSLNNQKQTKPKVIIADLQEQSLRGICLCFLRNSKKTAITGQNIINVIKTKNLNN